MTTSPDGLTFTSLSTPFEIDWSDLPGVANPGPDAEAAGALAAGFVVSIVGVTVAGDDDCAKALEANSAAPIVIAISLRMSLPGRISA